MKPGQISLVRLRLRFTQEQFGRLLGVHAMTVSRWERGTLKPGPLQVELMKAFGIATRRSPPVGEIAASMLARDGVVKAIRFLLNTAFV